MTNVSLGLLTLLGTIAGLLLLLDGIYLWRLDQTGHIVGVILLVAALHAWSVRRSP